MTQEKMTLLRERMIEDMRIHGMGDKAQKAHIRAVKDFAGFLNRSPDTATPDDLRAYQLHMSDTEVTPPTFNEQIMALRFLFGTTCDREDMKRYMQFRTQPHRLPTVLSIEEVSEVIAAAPERTKHRDSLRKSASASVSRCDGQKRGLILCCKPARARWTARCARSSSNGIRVRNQTEIRKWQHDCPTLWGTLQIKL